MVPYQLTTPAVFAIDNKYNNMIFLIILLNFFFESRTPEKQVDSDKVNRR
jgi:hypothetical protein